jgi:hypothetical protein
MNQPTEDPATEPLTPERLAEISARLSAASGLDWGYYDGGDYADVVQGYVPTGRGSYRCTHQVARLEADSYLADDPDGDDFDPDDEERASQQLLADAEFIAHAPRDVSDLLDENARLRAELAAKAERAWDDPVTLDAQAYRYLADGISATMADENEWDGDDAEETILLRYVQHLANSRDQVLAAKAAATLPVRQKCTPGELKLLDEWMQDHGDDPGAWPERVRLAYANTVACARAEGAL